MIKIKTKNKGFTLIEAMFAVSILAIGFLGTVSLIVWDRTEGDLEQERARAHQQCAQEMERARRDLWPSLQVGTSTTIWDNGTPSDASDDTTGTIDVLAYASNSGRQVTRASTNEIFQYADNSAEVTPATMLTIVVTLTWTPRGRLGASKTYTETIVSYKAP